MYFFSDIAICREEVKVVIQPANQIPRSSPPHPSRVLTQPDSFKWGIVQT